MISKLFLKNKPLFFNPFYLFNTTKRDTEELPYLELTRDFLDPKDFYNCLSKNGVHFYTGVPDSLLKDFCGYITGI